MVNCLCLEEQKGRSVDNQPVNGDLSGFMVLCCVSVIIEEKIEAVVDNLVKCFLLL